VYGRTFFGAMVWTWDVIVVVGVADKSTCMDWSHLKAPRALCTAKVASSFGLSLGRHIVSIAR
jgi:hypothetical protein